MREENQTIIKALNMFGRVPEQYELLNEIERLNNENHNLYLFIYEFIRRLEHIRDNGSKTYIKENLDLVIKYMNKEFKEYYNLQELKESGNNE